jgi:hypothetical protein
VEAWGQITFQVGTNDTYQYEGEDGDDVDAHDQEEVLQADAVSMQNVEDWGHSTRACDY